MTRNILTNDGMQSVEVISTFEVFGIKLFTYYNEAFNEYRVAGNASGWTIACGNTEKNAIECATAMVHNYGEARMNKAMATARMVGGVANEEGE